TPHLGIADDPGECRSRRAPGPERCAGPAGATLSALSPPDRRCGRHAGAYQVGADGDLDRHSGRGRQSGLRDLAGALSDRAPGRTAPARNRAAVHRGAPTRLTAVYCLLVAYYRLASAAAAPYETV